MARFLVAHGAAIVVAAALTACGGSNEDVDVAHLEQLEGATIGLVALDSIQSLELRYVLQEGAEVDSRALGGDVRYVEVPGDSLPELLADGEIEAAILPPQLAYGLFDDPTYAEATRIAAAMGGLTGSPVLATALLTYRDEVNAHPESMAEARRMLAESTSYFHANEDEVLDQVISEQSLEEGTVRWMADVQRTMLGDASSSTQDALRAIWEAAVTIGDIPEAPVMDDVLFGEQQAGSEDASRRTVSLAVLDDALHRAALYAIDQGLVGSAAVDLDVTYLAPGRLSEALEAREYDVVEGSPMFVVTDARKRLDLVVLSGGIEDLDSTLLFEAAGQ